VTVQGLIIDPQRDFCDAVTGSLYVPGAESDMVRLAAMLTRLASSIDAIHVTLDSHHAVDIAHPIWWRDPDGQQPAPFTIITASDLASGRWTTSQPESLARSRDYVESLERHGRYPLCIWPYHCLIGTSGHSVAFPLAEALTTWERDRMTPVDYVWKGANIWTENYSAIRADVPDPTDPATQTNTALLDSLETADLIFVAGEAGSHCVANTVRDIADVRGDTLLRKMVLLTDAVSPVTGFESLQADFLAQMTERGLRTSTTVEFLA
jgi:nicotinamidase-related amidase